MIKEALVLGYRGLVFLQAHLNLGDIINALLPVICVNLLNLWFREEQLRG